MSKRKQKQLFSILAAIVLVLALGRIPTLAADSVSVAIDGMTVHYGKNSGAPFIDQAGRTQVPFRATMEAFGCNVDWDEAQRTAIARKGDTTVRVPIGQPYIEVNGHRLDIDTSAVIRDNRTYLPIRAVLEAFGAQVSWDGKLRQVTVSTQSAQEIQIHFIDVGQGDATLIDCGEIEVLIDGGDNRAGATVVDYIRPYVDGPLDYIIATHPDADHIGGLDDVLEAYDVGEVIDSGRSTSSATYRDYINAAQSEPGCTFSYDENRSISLGSGTVLSIIETGDDWKSANDSSVVAQLVCGNVQVLFTGDLSEKVEKECLHLFGDIDVLKVGHHGSATSSSAAFLSVIKPEYAVASYKVGNTYHHPTSDAIQRLMDVGCTVYGTGKSGTIVMTTDGNTYSFNTTQALTLADAGA